MTNIPSINFKKVTDKGNTLFNQTEFYEGNFDKINQEIVVKINELDTQAVQLNTDLGDAEGRLDSAEADIDNHEGRIDAAELNKVDKVDGKTLSTNDYTNEDKLKLNTTIPEQLGEMDGRIDNIVVTPAVGVSEQEILDARQGKGSLGANITDVKSQLADVANQAPGKKLKIVACVIRNSGVGWALINDSEHIPVGVASIINDTDSITINYDFIAKKVISLVVTPDEIMAKNGIIAGSSVGTALSKLHVYKNYSVSGYITKSGGGAPVYVVDGSISNGVASANAFDAVTMRIVHDNFDLKNYPVGKITAKNGDMDGYISSFGLTETRVRFKSKTKILGGQVAYNGSVFGVPALSGVSSCVWDAASNSLLVTFTESFKNMIPSVIPKTDTTLTSKIYNYTANTIQVRFYDASGVLLTSPSTEMKVFVMASEIGGYDTVPYDGVYLFEKSGFAKMNPNALTYAGSNFWVYGIFEVD